jgi:hypothetical protein
VDAPIQSVKQQMYRPEQIEQSTQHNLVKKDLCKFHGNKDVLTSKKGVSSLSNFSFDLFNFNLIISSKNRTSYSRGDLVRRSVMNWVNICELTNWER